MSVPGNQGPSQGGGDDSGAPADIDDLAVRAEHDPAERAVAGESSELHDGEEMPVLRLVEPTGDALEGRQIAHQIDVGLLASHGRGVSVIEDVAGQVFEGVVPTLPWGPRVVWGRGRQECVDGSEEGETRGRGHPPVHPDHPTEAFRCGDAAQLHLLQLVPDRPQPVHRLPPVFEGPTGVGDPEVLDDVDQPILTFGVMIGQGSRLVEQNPSLIGGETSCGPGSEGGPGRTEYPGTSNEPIGPTRCHPTALLEECGERRVAEMVVPRVPI
jgi:hypothetical protein